MSPSSTGQTPSRRNSPCARPIEEDNSSSYVVSNAPFNHNSPSLIANNYCSKYHLCSESNWKHPSDIEQLLLMARDQMSQTQHKTVSCAPSTSIMAFLLIVSGHVLDPQQLMIQ